MNLSEQYILAIDQGTSSSRAMLFSLQGNALSSQHFPLHQSYPAPGWVEQDPEAIWQTTLNAIQDVLKYIPIKQVIACGITNQRETTLLWDKQTGECIAPAIVWQDRRTQYYCELLSHHKDMVLKKTGLILDPYFSASKIHWLLAQVPIARELANKNRLAFGTVDSFLLWRLTGGKSHLTDITNASRTLLFNIHTQEWDNDLLELFQIPPSILPTVCSSDAHFGVTDSDTMGFSLPITGVAGDQQAGMIGQGCIEPGMIKATFGTGGFLLLNTGSEPVISKHKLLTTIAYRIKNETIYGLEGSFYQAGSTIKWLRDGMQTVQQASETETLAQSLSGNDGVYLIPSFTGMGAPYWIDTHGGIITGLSFNTTRAHFARAALECVAYQTKNILQCMHADSGLLFTKLKVDGGMAANAWLLQFMSSLCNLSIQKSYQIESTALGVAIIAAIGVGMLNSLSSIESQYKHEKSYFPTGNLENIQDNYKEWCRRVNLLLGLNG